MIEQLLPLLTGGVGGLAGGNLVGSLLKFGGSGLGARNSSIVGLVVGALATHFFGPTLGPIIATVVSNVDIASILGNLLSGVGGGGIGAILFGILRSFMK